jgi:putative toxin-antitoxin system antitoxin component (TIGR02293 family)
MSLDYVIFDRENDKVHFIFRLVNVEETEYIIDAFHLERVLEFLRYSEDLVKEKRRNIEDFEKEVEALACKLFESEEKAFSWLGRPQMALGGKVPPELMQTEAGAKKVKDLLGRIEHGGVL